MGAGYFDYILADDYVVPETERNHYVEQVVSLPDMFQPAVLNRPASDSQPTREQHGLPEISFVFCCFNTPYKLTPRMFDVWMRILRAADSSVLWLAAGDAALESNLREETHRRGIDPQRLVFAPRLSYAEHLSRLAWADLFLDTTPFNAGATASDALHAGLPVLTCSGDGFASRMAGSLLHAAGLPELVTRSLDDYEASALQLAAEPKALAAIRQRLLDNRSGAPFFDVDRFRAHLESAYLTMWQRLQRGEKAQAFRV
jgi:predicted O-linked N-acetylglucosamine transferase (SPINDLY family)